MKNKQTEKWKLPYNPNLKERAKELRKAGNLTEALLWNKLKNKQLGYSFTRQKIIGNYIVDFFCPSIGLIIETDGSSHIDKYDYDQKRDEYFEKYNLTVLHIKDTDIYNNLDNVLLHILNTADEIKNKSFII